MLTTKGGQNQEEDFTYVKISFESHFPGETGAALRVVVQNNFVGERRSEFVSVPPPLASSCHTFPPILLKL